METTTETKDIYELLPHVNEMWLNLCALSINESEGKGEDAMPVFKNKRHLLAEIVASKSLHLLEEELTPKEREFCYAVEDYIQDNAGDEANWDIKHIILEEDEPCPASLTDVSDLIDPEVQEGSELKIGDRLKIENEGRFSVNMRVVGFDSDGCPIVKYTKVVYAQGEKPDGEKEGDEFQAGDILPFPWSNPSQYKITNNGKEANTGGN